MTEKRRREEKVGRMYWIYVVRRRNGFLIKIKENVIKKDLREVRC